MQLVHKQLVAILIFVSFIGCTTTFASDEAAESFSTQELHQLLAPIALYPDTVLTHVLIAATYPLEVVQADRWKQNHPKLTDEVAVNAGTEEGWDPSVTALLAFPDLLSHMNEDLEWTLRLGEAFLYSESDVLSAIQALRQQAYDSGNLSDLEHLDISQEAGNIVIAPIRREVVYIPYYDSHRVYGNWRWSSHPPAYWSHSYVSSYNRHGFYWGIHAPVSNWFYFGGLHWGQRNVVVVNNPYIHHNSGRHYSGSQLYMHHNANRWQHQPMHRRGVRYQDHRVHSSWSSRSHTTNGARQQGNTGGARVHHSTRADNNPRDRRNPSNTTVTTNTRDRTTRELATHPRSGPTWRTGSPAERNTTQATQRSTTNSNIGSPARTNPAQTRRSTHRDQSRSTTPTRAREPVLNGRIPQSNSTVRRGTESTSRNQRSRTTTTSHTRTRVNTRVR